MNGMNQVTKEKLVADFRLVASDAGELLRSTAGQAGEKVAELRAKARGNLAAARTKFAQHEAALVGKAQDAGRVTDDYVRRNPWPAIGIAAGVGSIVGFLIGRR